jgi:hypothetical protein
MQTHPPNPVDSFAIIYLDPKVVCFAYQGENLTFTNADGTFYPRVTLRRCFPLSAKRANIIVRIPESEADQGFELGIIENLEELDPASQEAVLRELQLHYFVPSILNIHTIREEFGFLYWDVETDRGPKEFIMRDSIIGSVRQVSPTRWLVIDINQTRYEVRDINDLDPKSQELLRKNLLL